MAFNVFSSGLTYIQKVYRVQKSYIYSLLSFMYVVTSVEIYKTPGTWGSPNSTAPSQPILCPEDSFCFDLYPWSVFGKTPNSSMLFFLWIPWLSGTCYPCPLSNPPWAVPFLRTSRPQQWGSVFLVLLPSPDEGSIYLSCALVSPGALKTSSRRVPCMRALVSSVWGTA